MIVEIQYKINIFIGRNNNASISKDIVSLLDENIEKSHNVIC